MKWISEKASSLGPGLLKWNYIKINAHCNNYVDCLYFPLLVHTGVEVDGDIIVARPVPATFCRRWQNVAGRQRVALSGDTFVAIVDETYD